MVPTGHSTQIVHDYYNYLYATYYQHIPVYRTVILWREPVWIVFWALTLILFFWVYTRYLNSAHRKKGELYGVASFAGSILERIGVVEAFTYVVTAFFVAWAIYFIVTQIVHGQLY